MRRIGFIASLFLSLPFATTAVMAQSHGIAMHGEPQLAKNFAAYTYANPNAPQGGQLKQAQIGSFDSLNPFSIRGNAARNIRQRVFESLLDRHYGEAFALYGLLAESLTASPDRSRVTFKLRREARFSDGTPVTASDIAFTWKLLKDQGRPNHRHYYNQVKKLETPNARTVVFHFDGQKPDRELPLIIGLMPILPKHIYETRDIQAASLELPFGSGPYAVSEITPGAQVRFEKRDDYWGDKLALNQGRHNITTWIDDYYRDDTTAFEAFKAGELDIWFETNPQRWQSGFNFPAAKDGRIVKQDIALGTPSGLRAFVLNTRRPLLADPVLRKALDLAFDFEWINKVLYGDVYQRTQSYFGNTKLSAFGQEASDRELELLQKSPVSVESLLSGYRAPVSDGSGRDRKLRRQAIDLLEGAGYEIRGKSLFTPSGQKVELEVMVQRRGDERLALSWRRMLAGIGIGLKVRLIDSSQYQRQLQTFDFDIIVYDYYASLSPGNEQAYYWGSVAADTQGSRNYAGVQDAGLDTALQALTQAIGEEDFSLAARALDRALMGGHYFIPLYHNPKQWVASWHYVEQPSSHSAYGARTEAWWLNQEN